MTNLITHIDKCLLKWIWFNTNRRYKWNCCLLLFEVTNNRVYNDAFRIFTFSRQQSVSFTWPIKSKSKRYHWIQKIPVLKRLFIQTFCKRSRCLEENPVFLFLSKKTQTNNEKEEFSPSLQVVFSIVDRSQFEI
jgi:hypothetical protein